MTLNEIAYMVLEAIREGHIVDDERLDTRLIYDWIDLKRSQYIKNQRTTNPNGRLNLNLYQSQTMDIEVLPLVDQGLYPFQSLKEDISIVQTIDEIPTIVEDKGGPIILNIESIDLMKLPFSVIDYDYMRSAGNGKFNKNLIFTSIRDNRVYFKYHEFFDTYTEIVIKAIFENPRDVDGFDPLNTRYPANLGLIEYVKNGIFDIDIKMLFAGQADEINDGSGEIKS